MGSSPSPPQISPKLHIARRHQRHVSAIEPQRPPFEEIVRIYQRETAGQLNLWTAKLQTVRAAIDKAASNWGQEVGKVSAEEARTQADELMGSMGQASAAADNVATILDLRAKDVKIQTEVVQALPDEYVSKMMLYGGATVAGGATTATAVAVGLGAPVPIGTALALLVVGAITLVGSHRKVDSAENRFRGSRQSCVPSGTALSLGPRLLADCWRAACYLRFSPSPRAGPMGCWSFESARPELWLDQRMALLSLFLRALPPPPCRPRATRPIRYRQMNWLQVR